jgi:hypothetical protein
MALCCHKLESVECSLSSSHIQREHTQPGGYECIFLMKQTYRTEVEINKSYFISSVYSLFSYNTDYGTVQCETFSSNALHLGYDVMKANE